jgi:hypothetical protein
MPRVKRTHAEFTQTRCGTTEGPKTMRHVVWVVCRAGTRATGTTSTCPSRPAISARSHPASPVPTAPTARSTARTSPAAVSAATTCNGSCLYSLRASTIPCSSLSLVYSLYYSVESLSRCKGLTVSAKAFVSLFDVCCIVCCVWLAPQGTSKTL